MAFLAAYVHVLHKKQKYIFNIINMPSASSLLYSVDSQQTSCQMITPKINIALLARQKTFLISPQTKIGQRKTSSAEKSF